MKSLWNYIDHKNWKIATKYKALVLSVSVLYAVFGLVLWGIVQIWALKTLDWMFTFVEFAIVISWFAAFLYSCNHDFHIGSFQA